MAVTFAVLGDSEPEAREALDRVCEAFGLEPLAAPAQIIGHGKWMGRARDPGARGPVEQQ